MSFTDRAAATARRLVTHYSTGNTVIIRDSNSSAYGDDLSVVVANLEYEVPCTTPLDSRARDFAGDSVPEGLTYVYINSSDSRVSFDPQPGMFALLAGEQYRIEEAKNFHGAWRLFLRGAATGGALSS